jgi:hypothetical protein
MIYALAANGVANIFNGFSNFPASFAEAFFDFAAGVISLALGLEFIVVDSSADAFFGFTLDLIPFSFHFVSIR